MKIRYTIIKNRLGTYRIRYRDSEYDGVLNDPECRFIPLEFKTIDKVREYINRHISEKIEERLATSWADIEEIEHDIF